ncbi:SIS domain-containing protein [Porphyromonas pogonae]|nr:SIS domain-containing protein [Porphyromonas pogonae]
MQTSNLHNYTIEEIIQAESEAIKSIPKDNDYESAISLIIDRVHRQGGRLITSGMGKAGQIALNIATTFSSTGTPAYFLHPSEAQHGDLGIIRPEDVLLIISNSGKTREVLELLDLAKFLVPDLPAILITGKSGCELAQQVDVCLATGDPREVCPLGLTPTTSTTVMTVIGDLLVVLTMQKIGFTYKDYSLRHHGGYLGYCSRTKSASDQEST